MYHKTDNDLNRQIEELNKIKINVSFKRIVVFVTVYFLLLPVAVYVAIATNYSLLLYVYLIPLMPVIFVTYIAFTGKLKWLIKLLHRFHRLTTRT